MSTAVIIGGGDFPRKPFPRELIRRADIIVCCDGNALKAFLRNRKAIFGEDNRLPEAIVGDMDSMTPKLAKEYSNRLVKIEEQDDNDQTKALHYILDHYPEVNTIHILAATGRREDHTVGNLGLLMEYARTLPSCHPERCPEPVEGRSEGSTPVPIVEALRQLGVPAELTGRNDIFVEGRKVSGYARRVSKQEIIHGTLMYDVDLDTLTHVLDTPGSKLQAKGIGSVKSRVANLKDYLPGFRSLDEVQNELQKLLAGDDGLMELTENQL